jgi:hypothetical protein
MYNILKCLSLTTESPEIVYSRTTRRRDSCNNNETMTSIRDNTVIIHIVICVLLLAMCVKATNLEYSYEQISATTTHMTVVKIN